MLSGRISIVGCMVVTADELRMSAQQVADRLGVAEKTVRRWIESGRLPASRRGKTYAILLADAQRVHGETVSPRSRELAELRAAYIRLEARYELLEQQLARAEARYEDELRRRISLEAKAAA
jgi:excisionase family DNA binding protein